MKRPIVSVYIVSNNYGKYAQEAIESLLKQEFDLWELFLINDNSSDNTQDIFELYRGDPKIRIFKAEGRGLASAANFALQHARGEYIMRLDADDVIDENMLLVLSNYLNRHPEAALVFPDYFLVDEYGGIIRYERRQSIYRNNHLLDMPANGACTLVRKEILEKVGGYREDLAAQDGFDIWTKISRLYKCANVNLPLFYYRRHGENLTDNHTRILNARRIIKKDACRIDEDQHRPIIAVIPCRRHYDIFPDLWNKKIGGRTLLEISIEKCVNSVLFDKIIIVSDNRAVEKVMLKFHDKRLVFFERSKESTAYSRSIAYTLENLIKFLDINWRGLSVISYIQSPFATTASLEEAAYTLILNDVDSAFAVEEIQENAYKRTPHGLSPISPQERVRSDFDIIYTDAPATLATKNTNLRNGSISGARISHFVMPKEEAFFIRTKRDYEIAKILTRINGLKIKRSS